MTNGYRNIIEIPERGYHYFRHYFIPHEGNNHHPLAVRPKALKTYSAVLIAVKVFLTGFLYIAYPTQAQFAELTASKIFDLTNAARVENGAGTLKLNASLSRAAQAKAKDMVRLGYFDHTGPDGKKFWQWLKEAGYSYSVAGENLAMDFTTAESAHRALMASVSHRNNILKSTYTEMGVAVLEGSLDGHETTVLVEYFGTPLASKRVAKKPAATVGTTPSQQQAQKKTPEAPVPSDFRAEFVGKSEEKYILLTGSEVSVWVDFKNTGTAVWYNNRGAFVALNVTEPIGRTSAFAHSSWVESYRPAKLSQSSVRPGEVGRFVFTMKAPQTPMKTAEVFALVAENLTWIEGGKATLPMTVVERRPMVAAAQETAPQPPTLQDALDQQFNTTAVEVIPNDSEPIITPAEEAQPTPLVVGMPTPRSDWQRLLIDWTIRFFWAFLIFLTISLFLTVLVRIRVQHRHAILQTVLVIVLTAFMIFVPFHYAERIVSIFVS